MNRKPRADSKLDNLTPESRVLELRDLLLSGASQQECKDWLLAECGVTTTGDALTRFWKKHCAPVIKEKRQLAAMKAEAIGDLAGSTDWDAASLESLRQMVFEFMSDPASDMDKVEKMFRLLLKRKDQEITERQIRLREEAAAEAKRKLEAAASKARTGGISEETLKELEEAAKLL